MYKKKNIYCITCGNKLPKGRGKYCKDSCCPTKPKGIIYVKNCCSCGKEFTTNRPYQIYCCVSCQIRTGIKRKPCSNCGGKKEYRKGTKGGHYRYCLQCEEIKQKFGKFKSDVKPRYKHTCSKCQQINYYKTKRTRKKCDKCYYKQKARIEHRKKRGWGVKKNCIVCNKKFLSFQGSGFCSDKCRKEKELIDQYNGKIKRKRAMNLNGVKKVWRIKVFEMAGWKCEACGVDTPRELKGTRRNNAPELDHIIPLSRGGKHNMNNVRLLCKKCNNEKGSRLDSEWITNQGEVTKNLKIDRSIN